MTTNKEHGIHISASVAVSWIGVGAFAWLFAEPLLMQTVSAALAEDLKQMVSQEVAPINGAFVALLQRDIDATKREIAALKYRQRRNENWEAEDVNYLTDKEIELDALKSAKAALENTS